MLVDIILFFEEISKEIPYVLDVSWNIVKTWGWLPLTFFLYGIFKDQYLYFIQEKYDNKIKRILLEIKMPKEVMKPIKAMEHVFTGFHGTLHESPPNWREKWIEGVFQLDMTLEIVSIEGRIHFYVRIPEASRNFIESSIFSQYPDAEISLADDYTKYVPQDIPNKDWNIWGADFVNIKEEAYPIKTYKEFEVESEKIEEKKIDPLALFLEGMANLRTGEQAWFSIKAKPVIGANNPWLKNSRELADKLARRPEKVKPKSIFQEVIDLIIQGPPPEKSESKELFPPEMLLTPGEKDVLTAIEEKMSKFGFECSIRFVYFAKRDIFSKTRVAAIGSFFKEISTENMNGFKPDARTRTKMKTTLFWFLDKRRLYLRQRRIFRYYINRMSPLFPRPGITFVLNVEELATLFHFPSEATISTLAVSRVDIKKKEAPFNLPIE